MMKKLCILLGLLLFQFTITHSQIIQELMESKTLSLKEIELKANKYFDSIGTGRGTGYKIFQRWLYERQFHVDKDGFYIDPNIEAAKFNTANASIAARSTATNWTELGPYNYAPGAGWNPGTGKVNAIVVDKNNDQVIYVATPAGGIWKTTNGGSSWQALTDNNTLTIEVYALAMNPQNSNTLYAATNSGGLWKTNDAGANWTYMTNTTGLGIVKGISINPIDTTNMFFASNAAGLHRIFRTTNGGTSWTTAFSSSSASYSLEDIVFHPTNTNIIYAAGLGYLRSTNNGQTWTVDPNFPTNVGRMRLAVTPANPNYVYIVQAAASNFGKMFRSTNSGVSFNTMVTGNPANGTNYFGYETNGTGTYGQAWYDIALTVSPINPDEVDIAGIICWKSTNGGSSFVCKTSWDVPTTFGYNHADVHNLYWVNGKMYAATDGGIYKSNDGGNSWIDISTGLGIQQIYRAASSDNFPTPLTVGAQDNGSTVLTNNGWKSWLGADGMEGAVSNSNPLKMYGTAQNGLLYRSDDGGTTRTYLGRPNAGNWVTPIAVHPTNDNIVYGGWNGFFKYDNTTNTFTNLAPGIITSLVHDFAICKSDPNRIYVVVNSNLYGTFIYKTIDGGSSWSVVPHPFGPGYTTSFPYTIYDIAVSPSNPDRYWIGTIDGVYCSYDGGNSYRYTDYNLPYNTPVRSIVIDDLPSQGVYCSVGGNVYYHDLNDTTWINYSANLPRVAINELDINYSAGKLRAAFYGRGIWELPIETSYNTCTAPSGLTINSVTATDAHVSWNTVSNVPNYTVEFRTIGGAWQLAGTPNTNSFNLINLQPLTQYEWRVRSNCSVTNTSAFVQGQFTTLTLPCVAPTLLTTLNIGTTTATLKWNSIPTNNTYSISIKPVGGQWINIVRANPSDTTETLTGLLPNTLYNWEVTTNCGFNANTSAQSQFTTSQIVCTTPNGLSTSSITATSAILNWQLVNGAIDYTVEYKTGNGSWILATTTNLNSYTLTSLQSSTIYDWRVRSNCGTNSNSAFVQTQFTTATNAITCASPTNLTVNNVQFNSADVSWQAVPSATLYTVEYKIPTSNVWLTAVNTSSTNCTITSLLSSTVYNWRVRSICGPSFASAFVTGADFTTTNACGVPTNLFVNGITLWQATINWNSVNNATAYNLQYKYIYDNNWTTVTGITSTSYLLTGLQNNTLYQYRIQSVCGGTNNTYSNIQQFTSACNSNGINNNEWISYFKVGSINRSSSADAGGYIQTGLQTNLTIGSSNAAQIGANFIGVPQKQSYAVYIDLNQNGRFTDAGERVFGVGLISSTSVRNFTITIPTTALSGLTTMRVVIQRQNPTTTNMTPCSSNILGETEDYIVNLVAPGPQAPVNNLLVVEKGKELLSIYPNPTTDWLNFTYSHQTNGFTYQVINLTGKVLLQGKGKEYNVEKVNVHALAAGWYFLKVIDQNGKSTSKKFVIGR